MPIPSFLIKRLTEADRPSVVEVGTDWLSTVLLKVFSEYLHLIWIFMSTFGGSVVHSLSSSAVVITGVDDSSFSSVKNYYPENFPEIIPLDLSHISEKQFSLYQHTEKFCWE